MTARIMVTKITVETFINAPIAKVWRAYTTPSDIMQWNTASDDWHTTKSTVDLRAGGNQRLIAQVILIKRANVHARHFSDPVGAGFIETLPDQRLIISSSLAP
jgi:hypothetical protein